MSAELAQQSAEWEQAVRFLEELDPQALVAVRPDVLDAIDEACRGPARAFKAAPLGAIRA